MNAKPVIVIDGAEFDTLEGFFRHFDAVALDAGYWGQNLNAFNDVLRGGFGTPEGGFVLEWRDHLLSKDRLGYSETVRQLSLRLAQCHPDNKASFLDDLSSAQRGEGRTVFDWLLDIIREHGPGGREHEDGVDLVLL